MVALYFNLVIVRGRTISDRFELGFPSAYGSDARPGTEFATISLDCDGSPKYSKNMRI